MSNARGLAAAIRSGGTAVGRRRGPTAGAPSRAVQPDVGQRDFLFQLRCVRALLCGSLSSNKCVIADMRQYMGASGTHLRET